MKLSVILPCFNGAETIAVQLAALSRQDFAGEWELLVVNNGSTDASMRIVESYCRVLPQLRIVDAYEPPWPRRGVAHSYSVGFAAAKGDAFLLCEADDEVDDHWLSAMAAALQEHDFVAASIEYTRLNPQALVPTWKLQDRDVGLTRISGPLFLPYASGCSLGLRRTVYERLGSPSEELGPSWDLDYCWEAYKRGITLHFVPDAIVHYRLRHGFRSRYKQAKAWGESHAIVMRKYGHVSSVLVAKHIASSGRRLVRAGTQLVPVLARRQTVRYWAWELGWCVGYLRGVRQLVGATVFGRRLGRMISSLHNRMGLRHRLIRAPFYALMHSR